jgi:hypothetical protein
MDHDAPVIVGKLLHVARFLSMPEPERLHIEAQATYAMREGLRAAGEHFGRVQLSPPAFEIARLVDRHQHGWKVQEGGSEAEGYYVIGYSLAGQTIPSLYGPYAMIEDATAVAAAEDFRARPRSEELLRREQEEMEEWAPGRKAEDEQ